MTFQGSKYVTLYVKHYITILAIWQVRKHYSFAARNYRTHVANTLLLDNALATIDYSENIRVLIAELRQAVPADPQFKTD